MERNEENEMLKLSEIDVNKCFIDDTVGFWDGFWERRNGLGAAPVYADPDSASETLRNYHQALWSRKLPNGEVMTLQKGKKSDYLTWNGMRFASDSIATQHRYIKCEHVIRQVESQMPNYRSFVYDTTRFTYTIGGMIIFPKLRGSMNQDRGTNPMIADRYRKTRDEKIKKEIQENYLLTALSIIAFMNEDDFMDFLKLVEIRYNKRILNRLQKKGWLPSVSYILQNAKETEKEDFALS